MLLSALPTLLIATALVVVGAVIGPQVGPAKGRMWTGLAILLVQQLLGLIWVFAPMAIYEAGGYATISVLSAIYGVLSGILFVTGVAVLASAIVLAHRSGFAFPDPNRPGAAPGGYGYGSQPSGGYGVPPAGGSPYVAGPDQPAPPR